MLNNTRHLHIILNAASLHSFAKLNLALLKRKFPGEHVVLLGSDNIDEARGLDFFHEFHVLDCQFIQKSAFSPLLGDATAFAALWETVKPLTESKWMRIFNLGGTPCETALASLFQAPILGPERKNAQSLCQDSPLKLQQLLWQWKMNEPWLQNILQRRSLHQLDFTSIEKSLQQVTDLRSHKGEERVRGVLAGVRLTGDERVEPATLDFLQQLFRLVALDTATAQQLTALGIKHIDWSQTPAEEALLLDLIIQDVSGKETFWHHPIDIRDKLPEDLTDKIAELVPRNFSKWACLSFFFDYLAQPRLALMSEKMLTRYDRLTLQPFLHQEVLALKDFAKLLLDGIRRQGSGKLDVLTQYWESHPSILSFVAAIELSLHPALRPIFRNDQDVLAVKNRLRTLNALYERLHKAFTLEMPKTDLALTL